MVATMRRQIIPGMRPRTLNAEGKDRTPRPIWVFIMSPAVPTQPTWNLLACEELGKDKKKTYIAVIGATFSDFAKDGIFVSRRRVGLVGLEVLRLSVGELSILLHCDAVLEWA